MTYIRLDIETTPAVQLWRVPHDFELLSPGPSAKSPDREYRGNTNGTWRDTKGITIPEPFRLQPEHQTPLDCSCQKLIRDCNPEHKDDVVDKILDQAWILANNTGLGVKGRKNCRSGEYMNDSTAKWPAFHTPIICGGAALKGSVAEGYLYIESILTSETLLSASYVLERPWLWFWLVEISPTGKITYMRLAGKDGQRHPVRVPLISRLPLYAPVKWFQKLPLGFILPDPMWIPE
jgi:hypothetical protein